MILCDWRGGLLLLVTKVLYFTCTWLKKYFMYLMPPRYIEYLSTVCAKNMKKKKKKKIVLKSSTSKNTWLGLFLQLISSPSTVFDANILSNITYQSYIPKDLLCISNFPSSYSVFVHSPCGQIYVSTVYHKNNGYCWWLLLDLSWGNRLKSVGLVNKLGPDTHGWPFTNNIFKCVLFKYMFCISFNFQRIWLILSNLSWITTDLI